jgi:hypothetical protein
MNFEALARRSSRCPAQRAGFTTAVLAPEEGLVRGRSALVNLGEGGFGANVIEPDLFQHISLHARMSGRSFPSPR